MIFLSKPSWLPPAPNIFKLFSSFPVDRGAMVTNYLHIFRYLCYRGLNFASDTDKTYWVVTKTVSFSCLSKYQHMFGLSTAGCCDFSWEYSHLIHGQTGPRSNRTRQSGPSLGTNRTTFWDKPDHVIGQTGPCLGHTGPWFVWRNKHFFYISDLFTILCQRVFGLTLTCESWNSHEYKLWVPQKNDEYMMQDSQVKKSL